MTTESVVVRHYAHGSLETAILAALSADGRQGGDIAPDHLKAVDEFHIGGREATHSVLASLDLSPDMRVLDVGCGIGGTARTIAASRGCRVTGVDLSPEYVSVARRLSTLVGMADRVDFRCASALDMPFGSAAFDAATMLHVGMNIADKAALFGEIRRVTKPGAVLGIYDVMRLSGPEPAYPLPWAASAATCHASDAATYRRLLAKAGFAVDAEEDMAGYALDFLRRMRRRTAESGVPALGLHILMGVDFAEKTANLVANLEDGVIAPTRIVARAAAGD